MNLNTEEYELLGDSKYRAYIAQVEKALRNFESTSEWADLIAALGKLNKVLSAHVKYPVIPKRVTIGKRLAQCLHPALPSGVHLKALETYDIIFKCIGTPRLASDLFTYSAGLFPLLAHAALNVKPNLLLLYETHFVPLGKHIKPALSGLLLGLLPGLEEGSESFDRTVALLEEFCEAAEPTYFYSCMWECVLSNPAVRLAAINYVLQHFNRKQSMEDQIFFMGSNIDLLVEALCISVQDQSVLVQRSALDLLLVAFPMHNSQLTRTDMVRLCASAIKVVLRRDMSLNRRLYAWLLGTDAGGNPLPGVTFPAAEKPPTKDRPDNVSMCSEPEMDYFLHFSRGLLISGIKACIHECHELDSIINGKPANLRPFRILISLLDRPEIGSSILEDILIDVFRCMYRECLILSSSNLYHGDLMRNGMHRVGKKKDLKTRREDRMLMVEVIKTANLLFGAFEPNYIWDFIGRTFEKSCAEADQNRHFVMGEGDASLTELCLLVDFLLDKVSLETYLETQTEYLPELLRTVTNALCHSCTLLSDSEMTRSLKLCSKILSKVLPSMAPVGTYGGDGSRDGSPLKHPIREANAESVELEDDPYISPCEDATHLDEEKPVGGIPAEGEGVEGLNNDSFQDFVQYDKVNRFKISPGKKPLKHSEATKGPATLMQSCIHSFQKLFHTYVSSCIIKESHIVDILLEQLMRSKSSSAILHYPAHLEGLACNMTGSDATPGSENKAVRRLDLQDLPKAVAEAFLSACQLLTEFSSLPMYCTDYHKVLQNSFRADPVFPEWLKLLMTCACFVDNFSIQTGAISTMIDLISLTQSVLKMCDSEISRVGSDNDSLSDFSSITDEQRQRTGSEGTVSVVILPALSPKHLQMLNTKTTFYETVAINLWNYLGEMTPSCHSRSVELLDHLHQLAPDSLICENVIGNGLLSEDKVVKVGAYKRFAVLWHLLRDKTPSNTPGKVPKTFDRSKEQGGKTGLDLLIMRSMFLMLDSLQSDTHPCRALTQTWLTHAVQRGDIARVLEPLLLILLHPDTARVSIQHVNIHQPKRVRMASEDLTDAKDDAETKIYAISSEGGNVIYHVSNNSNPNKLTTQRSREETRTFTMTSIGEGGSKGSTRTAKTKMEAELLFEKVNPTELNVRVNPFGSASSSDRVVYEVPPSGMPNLQNVKRLDAETCKKEGIFFEEQDGPEESDLTMEVREEPGEEDSRPDEEKSTEEIVAEIIEGIIVRVLEEDEEDSSLEKEVVPGTSRLGEGKDFVDSGADQLLNSIEGRMSEIDESDVEAERGSKGEEEEMPTIHPLHTHILLYGHKFDAQRTLYALSCLKTIFTVTPKLATCAVSTTNISSTQTIHMAQVQNLLLRHRRSVFGKNFYSEFPAEALSTFRSTMFIEVLISLCLYFIRSYYPNLMMSKLSENELNGNKEVQILSCEILTVLLSELVNLGKDSGRGFATYINDLLTKCKVQKTLLHCILASVYNARKKADCPPTPNFTEAIISFNEENMDVNTNDTFQVKLLKLLLVVIHLEDQIMKARGDHEQQHLPSELEYSRGSFLPSLTKVRYFNNRPVVYQSMLLTAVLSALKQQHRSHMHRHWVATVTSALPFLGRALSSMIVAMVNQLCRNIELLSQQYELGNMYRATNYQPDKVPPDHIITLLEGLTTLCHYCLLDSVAQQDVAVGLHIPASPSTLYPMSHGPSGSSGSTTDMGLPGAANDRHILTNLIHVFNPMSFREPSPAKEQPSAMNPVLESRRHLLSHLPRILSSLSILWKAIHNSEHKKGLSGEDQPCWTMGPPKQVRQYILEFISPISRCHSVNLMGAVAVVWNDRRQRGTSNPKRLGFVYPWMRQLPLEETFTPLGAYRVIPEASEDQQLLVELVSAVKVLPTDTLIQTVKQVILNPPSTASDKGKKRTSLEVSLLQFFFAYVQRTLGTQLVDSWPALLSLLKEGLQINLSPPGQFILLGFLSEFVQKIPMFEDRKDLKDLQDITQKLLESVGEIAGASLEQTTFFRRNLVVKPGAQIDVHAEVEDNTTDQEAEYVEPVLPPEPQPIQTAQVKHNYRQYSVQALVIMAELTATLLDVVYRSEEKDRVVPLLHNLMYNVFPYLKNHSPHNLPSFRACAQLLSSLSGYQYTRKAWKKEAFELLLDSSFFQTDDTCIRFWRVIVDNLMTHDKTTFRDLLTRVTITQGASLNLFSSREQEIEQRGQLLKRLSFTVFCSDLDQYQRNMPEIQERLADSLRLPSVPSVQAQVFLCFRVLIMRVSPQHLTSLWPTIITELVQVLLQIEQELCPDVEDSRTKVAQIANLDPSWALQGNGLNQQQHGWLRLYLAACKLLDLALVLPADMLPQFQLYRWAFIGDATNDQDDTGRRFKDQVPYFTPHIIRIAKLLNARYCADGEHSPPMLTRIPGCPLLRTPSVRSLRDLHAFFNTIALSTQNLPAPEHKHLKEVREGVPKSRSAPDVRDLSSFESSTAVANSVLSSHRDGKALSSRQYIEEMLEADFLEHMPRA